MDRAFLEELGLNVSETDGMLEGELELHTGSALNPLTRKTIDRVTFSVLGDRLLFIAPPELVGAQPINLAFLSPGTRLDDVVVSTLNEHLFQLERRSNELAALGISPQVDPQSLQLTAELERAPLRFTIGASRSGQFRLLKAVNGGEELGKAEQNVFELSEFFEKRALEEFLFAFYSDVVEDPRATLAGLPNPEPALTPPSPSSSSSVLGGPPEAAVSFQELFSAFGGAVLPPRSPLEVSAGLTVSKGQTVRFVASRVHGKTFRGLLAGPAGKIWADRFEVDEFPGLRKFVSQIMSVPEDEVEVINQ